MISRGEIWDVEFTGKGDEIQKIRPCVVVSSDLIGKLNLRVVVPITGWKDEFSSHLWFVKLTPGKQNGLSKPSAADAFQVKSISVDRFVSRRGAVAAAELEDIVAAIALVVGTS